MKYFNFENQYHKANEHLGKCRSVLDHGEVALVDVMGNDTSLAEAARVSFGRGDASTLTGKSRKEYSDAANERLLRRLKRDRHTSTWEMTEMKFLIKCPIFVMRQWIRHRTANVNEFSGRYAVMPDEYYVPHPNDITTQDPVNHQGGTFTILDGRNEIRDIFKEECRAAFQMYEDRVSAGMRRELARINLPLSTYTTFYWKVDVHNLCNFLSLRNNRHAQKEIRLFAEAIEEFFKECFPQAHRAYVDYQKESVSFSRMEYDILKAMVQGYKEHSGHTDQTITTALEMNGCTRNEIEDFLAKLEI